MKRINNQVLKAMIFKKNYGNNKKKIVGYVTVFIYKIRCTPRSAEVNSKYQENDSYLEIFTVDLFCRKLFF